MLKTYEREKLLNALIFFSENVLYPGKTKLFKLLNYLDFIHFQKTGRSVTGLDYFAWDAGPVPVELNEELKKPKPDFIEHLAKKRRLLTNRMAREELQPRKKFDEKYFSPFQLEIMQSLVKKHFRENAEEISELTHFETGPWHEVYEVQDNRSGLIPYEFILKRRGNNEDMEILEIANGHQSILSHYK